MSISLLSDWETLDIEDYTVGTVGWGVKGCWLRDKGIRQGHQTPKVNDRRCSVGERRESGLTWTRFSQARVSTSSRNLSRSLLSFFTSFFIKNFFFKSPLCLQISSRPTQYLFFRAVERCMLSVDVTVAWTLQWVWRWRLLTNLFWGVLEVLYCYDRQ